MKCRARDNHINGKQTAQDLGWKPKDPVAMTLRVKVALFFINTGIKFIPKSILSETLLHNFVSVGWIKAK